MRRARILGAFALVALASACHSTPPPWEPASTDDPSEVAAAGAGTPSQRRLLVLGALDDLSIQPIGGLEAGDVRVARTYFFWALAPKLRDELHAALRAKGLRVVKDSLDLGAPAHPASFPKELLVLRGTIHSFSFSRPATVPLPPCPQAPPPGPDALSGDLELRLAVGESGAEVWTRRLRVGVRAPRGPDADPFAAFARELAARLLADPELGAVLAR